MIRGNRILHFVDTTSTPEKITRFPTTSGRIIEITKELLGREEQEIFLYENALTRIREALESLGG